MLHGPQVFEEVGQIDPAVSSRQPQDPGPGRLQGQLAFGVGALRWWRSRGRGGFSRGWHTGENGDGCPRLSVGGLGPATSLTLRRGLSASTVPMPTRMASWAARSPWVRAMEGAAEGQGAPGAVGNAAIQTLGIAQGDKGAAGAAAVRRGGSQALVDLFQDRG